MIQISSIKSELLIVVLLSCDHVLDGALFKQSTVWERRREFVPAGSREMRICHSGIASLGHIAESLMLTKIRL